MKLSYPFVDWTKQDVLKADKSFRCDRVNHGHSIDWSAFGYNISDLFASSDNHAVSVSPFFTLLKKIKNSNLSEAELDSLLYDELRPLVFFLRKGGMQTITASEDGETPAMNWGATSETALEAIGGGAKMIAGMLNHRMGNAPETLLTAISDTVANNPNNHERELLKHLRKDERVEKLLSSINQDYVTALIKGYQIEHGTRYPVHGAGRILTVPREEGILGRAADLTLKLSKDIVSI